MATIDILPLELISQIYKFLDPASHLDFAITSKHIFKYSSDLLAHHRRCHVLYRLCSDRDLNAFPRLLLNIAKDHIVAWHIRIFEVWNASAFYHHSTHERSRLSAFFESEINSIAPLLRNRIRAAGIQPWFFEDDGLILKDLGALEALMFAMCTRLQSIKFVQSAFVRGYLQKPHPSNHLRHTIQRISTMAVPAWPNGYQSLRTVVLNCEGGNTNEWNWIKAPAIVPLFFLPNIETLYISGLADGMEEDDVDPNMSDGEESDDDDNDDEDDLIAYYVTPDHSSSVKRLIFETASGDVNYTIIALINYAKSLESIIFKDCEFSDFDTIVQTLAKYHSDSLRTLIYCGLHRQLRGYRCRLFRPEELDGLTDIRTITLDSSDVILGSLYGCDSNGVQYGLAGNLSSSESFVKYFLRVIPESIETLIFTELYERVKHKDIQAFDDALVCLIEKGHCPQLKAVYVEKIEAAAPRVFAGGKAIAQGGWFRRTVESGKKHGIDVFTLADRGATQRCLTNICNSVIDPSLTSA